MLIEETKLDIIFKCLQDTKEVQLKKSPHK